MANAPKILTPRQMVEKYGKPHLFKIQGRDGTLAWEAQPGMQERLFQLSETGPPETQADEILIGGIRGPGKSAGLLAWLSVPVWNPKYVGLLVRYSAEAMKETIEEAWDLYRKMGARKRARPTEFHFPSEWAGGAIIYTGHFKDERSLEDVRGHQYQRIGIEELCQIPSFSMYTQLAGANRTTIEGLPAKVCSTANPDGPGNFWVKKHFIDVYSGGTKIEPGTPFIDPVTKRVRVFIRGIVGENFALHSKDPGYYDRLRMNPPHIVKAWIDGDWDASASQVFEEWRPNGPLPADPPEPAWARHVIGSRPIVPWAHRWASCDWGYSHHAACHWAAIGEDKRIHVTDELVARKHEPDRLGAEWAKVTAPMLEGMEPEHHITLYFSHEAFRNKTTSERTIGDMFMLGVERILGPGSVFMMRHTDEEKQLKVKNPEAALELLLARRRTLGKRLRVTIRVNNPDRVAGLAYAHTLLRWKMLEDPPKPDMDYAYALLQEPNGHLKFEKYMRLFDAVTPEVLPGVVIHDRCKELIECIPKLQPDPDRLEDNLKFHGDMMAVGDDPWESFRSLCMGFKDVENRKPARVLFAETVQKFVKAADDFNTVVQVGRFTAAKQAHERKQLQGDVFLEYDCLDEIRREPDLYAEPV